MNNNVLIEELPYIQEHKSELNNLRRQKEELEEKIQKEQKILFKLKDITEVCDGVAIACDDDSICKVLRCPGSDVVRSSEYWYKERSLVLLSEGRRVYLIENVSNKEATQLGKKWVAQKTVPEDAKKFSKN